MTRPLKVLMVEDNQADNEMVVRALRRAGFDPQGPRVETERAFLDNLHPELDIILSDYHMPQFSGLRALELLREKNWDIPFILISGTIGEDAAVGAIKQGATDYLLKDRLVRLGPAIESALQQRHLAEERRKLEEQFRQSQKMEAIGQLSGGVAHDFNNILTVIQMHSAMMEFNSGFPREVRESARQIGEASERAANLTRQLLTFSRRQHLHLGDLSLNEVVKNLVKMLQRILGADIHMELHYSPEPIWVHADAGMMDQILLNLVVNSRDAMPNGGKLVIETSIEDIDEMKLERFPEGRTGLFACLSVSDAGCGIPEELLPRIFDPFFTTKEVGKGTGLGLATVYGIVQQHHGWIDLDSRVGRGTTFRIYLPIIQSAIHRKTTSINQGASAGGSETILVVEDNESLRSLVVEILGRLGYRVLEASAGPQAIEICNRSKEEINLLLTDLIIPGGINGVELAKKLVQKHPGMKVLYTSGYSPEIAGQELHLEEGLNFIAKPYYPNKLAQTIRTRMEH